jgi:hypothetical protein
MLSRTRLISSFERRPETTPKDSSSRLLWQSELLGLPLVRSEPSVVVERPPQRPALERSPPGLACFCQRRPPQWLVRESQPVRRPVGLDQRLRGQQYL